MQIECATIPAGIFGGIAAEHPSLWHPPSQCHVTLVQHALPPLTVPGVHSLEPVCVPSVVGPMFCLSALRHLAQSAVAEHAAQESHDIDWEGATVMDVQQQYHRRCLLESWHIRSALKTMNREEGNLPPVYDLLIRQSHSPD